jgi:hypothetical protein
VDDQLRVLIQSVEENITQTHKGPDDHSTSSTPGTRIDHLQHEDSHPNKRAFQHFVYRICTYVSPDDFAACRPYRTAPSPVRTRTSPPVQAIERRHVARGRGVPGRRISRRRGLVRVAAVARSVDLEPIRRLARGRHDRARPRRAEESRSRGSNPHVTKPRARRRPRRSTPACRSASPAGSQRRSPARSAGRACDKPRTAFVATTARRREPTRRESPTKVRVEDDRGTRQDDKRPTQEGRPQRGSGTKRSVAPGDLGGPTAHGEKGYGCAAESGLIPYSRSHHSRVRSRGRRGGRGCWRTSSCGH